MATKISKPIVNYRVTNKTDSSNSLFSPAESNSSLTDGDLIRDLPEETSNIIEMHERIERPEMLKGSTYKIKTPYSEHALYVTINDMIVNAGTPYERKRPYEIFLNSKNMDNFQWTVALTRIISAVFRKGGDSAFLVEEMQAVFDPRGGYFQRGGKYIPSLVAEIGSIIETHMKRIGMIQDEALPEHTQKILQEKRQEFEARTKLSSGDAADDGLPEGAVLCHACNIRAVVYLDGCMTCLNCGDSKCS
ncbi:MAG: hypothetical protein OXI60_00735 [Acidiferrobacterales bacterium]|nr:hypothetical protein [Acidiferrobacterales bacterium]